MKLLGIVVMTAGLALGACERSAEAPPAPEPEPTALGTTSPPVSIIRPEIEVEREEPALADLNARINFAEGGAELSEEALSELATIIASPQMEAGGAIVLRGHSDSVGSDEVNLRASQSRAEAVRDYLLENGVAEERIRIIALGEMRPIAPNATLEGEPDEEGRAANRRVEVFIAAPRDNAPPAAPPEEETVAESMADEE